MNQTEQFVMNFYQSINVYEPLLLSTELIIEALNIELVYWNHTSAIAKYNDKYTVFINNSINTRQQWQDFGHEMYHYFYDNSSYDLLIETHANFYEIKADYFSYHFCIPSFMLNTLKGVDVYDVMNLFNVEFDFALKRLEMHKNKLLNRRNHYVL